MAMQLRSGRRVAASPPVPAPRGALRRVRPRRSQDGSDDNEKDWISNLPKDMRLEVLARLPCTQEAMRTSVLSEPWRHLWTELRELTFNKVADLDWLLSALAQVQSKLNRLYIQIPINQLGGVSISSLLHAADKLEPLELVVRVCKHRDTLDVVLPCFTRTTSMELHISGPRSFKLPPTGSFASLERMTLSGPGCFIDPGVLLPRCPRLRMLEMHGNCPRGVKALAVESSSLDELVWRLIDIKEPVDVHIVAPNLEHFVFSSFSRKFTLSLSTPKLEESYLECYDLEEDSIVGFAENERWRLYKLKLEKGPTAAAIGMESGRHGRQQILSLYIHNHNNVMVIPLVERSFEQEVARLPGTLTHFSALELHLRTEGHVFGALVLELLQIRTDIQRLKIIMLEAEDTKCWEHYCDCDVPSDWRSEVISLPHLEVVEFEGFRGQDHEMDFLKLLFGSAPSLKTMSVQHFNEVSIVRGACQKLHNMFSANASVKFSFS